MSNSIIEAQAEYFDQQFFWTGENCRDIENQEIPPPSIEDQQKNFWDYKLANDSDRISN